MSGKYRKERKKRISTEGPMALPKPPSVGTSKHNMPNLMTLSLSFSVTALLVKKTAAAPRDRAL